MSTISSQEVISVIKGEIESYDMQQEQEQETGSAIWVDNGVAIVYGVNHAMYSEIIVLKNGVKGMVQDIQKDEVSCILFGKDTEITEGTKVVHTEKKADIPVGNGLVGRVINALGEPTDGFGPVKEENYRPIEQETPEVVDGRSVGVPMGTGILAIDSMFPIGRGRRELIIGNRQTRKTSITMGTILNQRGKDVICVYVTVGQKAPTVANLVTTLRGHDATDYTIVLSPTASESAPLQYVAPCSGTAMVGYFMHQGKGVLTVYDDLSKHAVACRTLSLLLEYSPEREAYPGDVFYLHSRLLEHPSRLNDSLGGGSITASPIVETQAGDVSACIPTNVISITGGQIFLESDLFFSDQCPAVDIGLSVFRVGGAAQIKAMGKASGSIRTDLAQYREMGVFTQFGSGLDVATKEQLTYSKRLMELLKQPLGRPLNLHEQVITLYATTGKVMLDVEINRVEEFQMGMLVWFDDKHSEIGRELKESTVLSDELREHIIQAAGEYKQSLPSAKGWGNNDECKRDSGPDEKHL